MMNQLKHALLMLAMLVSFVAFSSPDYDEKSSGYVPKGYFRCSLVVSSTADSGPNTLREAIACATSGQTITFAPTLAGQTITLASTLEIPIGKNLTIDGAAAANLTISGNNAVRVFLLRSTSVTPTSLTLRNLRIINGFHTEYGAGIRSEHQGVMTIENCIFNNNNAEQGGSAVFSHFEGRATIRDCKFDGNISIAQNTERGSTVMLWGPHGHTVQRCEFTNNRGINGAAINGLNAALLIEDCLFLNNRTTDAFFDTGNPNPFLRGFGGAIYTDRATPATPATLLGSIIIRRSRFEGQRAEGEGGACYLYTDDSDNVLIEDCYFNDNEVGALTGGTSGGSGGAIQHMNNVKNKGFVLRNTTFSNNRAGVTAGAVRVDWADTDISNCTFFNNRAQLTSGTGTSANGGALAFFSMSGSTVEVTNSTFANNYAGWVGGAIAGPASVRIRNNIFFQNTAGNGGNTWNIRQQASEHLTDLGGNIQFPDKANNDPNNRNVSATVTIANPLLNAIASNGGFAPTMSLQAGSPAINFGVTTGAPATDQTGTARTGNPDAGAVEFTGPALPPAQPAAIVLATVPKFDCGMSEAAIAATGAARLTIGGSTYYIGTRQVTSINQNPIMAKFTGGVLDWCREDYEMTGADGRGYGLFWSGTDLYAVFSTDGTQGTVAQDYRRFTGSGWLKHYTDASPGGGGGPKVAIILKINTATGEGITGNGTFMTARNSANQTNSLEVRDITLNSSGNLVVRANSWFSPRKTDRTTMTQTGTGGSPHDYTVIFTPDLTTAVCASAVGWDNGTGVDCLAAAPAAPEIVVQDGATNIADNTGSVAFGSTVVGTSLTKTFTIRNMGTTDLTLGALASLPTGFAPVGTFPVGTVAAGGSVNFQIQLTATSAGTFNGNISFANNDSDENPFNFAVSGTVAAVPLPPPPPVSGGGGSVVAPVVTIAPPNVTFTYGAGNNQPVLNWQIAQGTPTGIRIERRIAGSNQPFQTIATLPAADRSYTDAQTTAATLYEYRVVIQASGQPDAISGIIQIATAPQAPQGITAAAICGAGSTQIQLPAVGSGISYRWYTASSGGTAFLTAGSGEVVNLPAQETTTFYVAAVFQNLESTRTAVTVTVLPLPQAVIATAARNFCGTGMLAAEPEPETTYEWQRGTETVGSGAQLAVTQSGIYRLIARRNGCVSVSAPTVITVTAVPVAEFDDNQTVLFCGIGQLQAKEVLNARYEWTNEQNQLIGGGQTLSVSQSGTYRLTVIVNNCRSNTNSIDITVHPVPARPVISQSGSACEGGTLQLSTPEVAGATYEWRGPNGFAASSRTVTIAYDLAKEGRYSLTISTNGCRSEEAAVNVQFSRPIRYQVQTFAPTCRGSNDGYFTVESRSAFPLSYSMDGTEWTQNFYFGNLRAGTYRLFIRNAEGCTITASVIISEAPVLQAQIAADQTTINQFEQAQLQASGGISYEWSPAAGLSAANIPNPIAKPEQTTTYTVRIRNDKGCEATASITITVIKLDITLRPTQKVLSPNGDGFNDTWVIEHLERYERHHLRIMDRWGRTVFETRQYRNDWSADGLPDGVYYYLLEVKDAPALSGAITVAR